MRYVRVPAHVVGPESFRRYYDELVPRLRVSGIDCAPDDTSTHIFWNPFAGWGEPPEQKTPDGATFWLTFHGGAAFSRPLRDVFGSEEAAEANRSRVEHCYVRWQAALPSIHGVIVPSEYGAQEFHTLFNFPRARIKVIPHGVNQKLFNMSGEAASNIGFLHVSSGGPVKNLSRLVQAYASLPVQHRPSLTLVMPAERFTPEMAAVSGVRLIPGPIPSGELAKLYRAATALVHPSLWETFALTILEAMACGCPVLAGDNSAMREYYVGAALLVDAESPSAIAEGMTMLLNEDRRAALRRQGRQQAKRSSWEKVARAHARAFFPRDNFWGSVAGCWAIAAARIGCRPANPPKKTLPDCSVSGHEQMLP
jgi:glycosyltransferase involved in cell wall biosynthesis